MAKTLLSVPHIKFIALLLPFCLASCMSDFDTVTADVNPESWQKPAVLSYANTDTLSLKEAALVLRYGVDASPKSGMYIIEARSPEGFRSRDTLHITLVPDIRMNNLQEMRIPYRTKVLLGESGNYVFTVIPPHGACDIWNVAIDFKKIR